MGKHALSKTSYIKGTQCLKYLYLYKHHYNYKDKLTAQKLSVFRRGTDVGVLARELFPDGINLTPASFRKYDAAIQQTQQCIEEGKTVLYEPAFVYNGVLIFLDILVKEGDGWHACEVKSSALVSETYINDAALQYYVLTGNKLNITKFSLIHINPDYVRQGDIDLHALFTFRNVLDEVNARANDVHINVEKQKNILQHESIPAVAVGPHCYAPYDCDFLGFCWKGHQTLSNILSLPYLTTTRKNELWQQGMRTAEDLIMCNTCHLSDMERLHTTCIAEKKEYVNKEMLRALLWTEQDKLVYMHIFGYKPALPLATGCKPYDFAPCVITASLPDDSTQADKSFFCTPDASSMNALATWLQEMASHGNKIIVYDANVAAQLLDTIESITGQPLSSLPFVALKNILESMAYASPKLRGQTVFEDVLTALSLKNPYPDRSKPSNPYDAAQLYEKYLESPSESEMEQLKNTLLVYGQDNLRYLKRLGGFLGKKTK